MRRFVIAVIAALAILAAFATTASAFTMSEKVVVSNQLIAIARVGAGGYTADQRIDMVNQRLAYILGYEPLAPKYIQAVPMRDGSRALMVGNRLLMTVTAEDAMANNATVPELTKVWLMRARQALPLARPNANLAG